ARSGEVRKKVLGEKHPEYTESLTLLALLYRARGNAEERVEPLARAAWAALEGVDPQEYAEYGQHANILAALYEPIALRHDGGEDLAAARKVRAEQAALLERARGPGHWE